MTRRNSCCQVCHGWAERGAERVSEPLRRGRVTATRYVVSVAPDNGTFLHNEQEPHEVGNAACNVASTQRQHNTYNHKRHVCAASKILLVRVQMVMANQCRFLDDNLQLIYLQLVSTGSSDFSSSIIKNRYLGTALVRLSALTSRAC